MKSWLKAVCFLLVSCVLISNVVFSADYEAIVDNNFSPYMGGQDLISSLKILQLMEDAWIIKGNPKRGWKPSIFRFCELVLLWDPLNSACATIQHEVFGHGYRIREIGERYAKVNSYEIGWPPPYSLGGGATEFGVSNAIKGTQMNAIAIAGIEAEGILSRQLKMKWMVEREMDGRSATLYFNTQQALFFYSLATKLDTTLFGSTDELITKGKYPDDGNDIVEYIYWINQMYPKDPLSKGRITALSAFNFLDAFTLYVPYAWWVYVLYGKAAHIPMFKLWDVSYLPNYKLTLAPYGLEQTIENFFSKGNRPYYFYVKWGSRGGEHFLGSGFEGPELFSWSKGSIGLRMDLWKQPSYVKSAAVSDLISGDVSAIDFGSTKTLYGVATSIISKIYLGEKGIPFSLYFEGGYKTKGYLPGYPLGSGAIWRIGLSGKF